MNPWIGIRNATSEPTLCPQKIPQGIFQGNEDCLYMDIATTTLQNKKLPVLVWVHGGMFRFGHGRLALYGPERLMAKKLVLVSLNYREGLFGYLSTNTHHAPGNLALKDLVNGLRWIKRNIRNFGGDPNNVVLYGLSTGGMMVELLMVSPMAEGLFHKAIVQSGSIMSNWALNKNPVADVFTLARYFNISSMNLDEIMRQLNNIDAMELLIVGDKMVEDRKIVTNAMAFVPTVEKYISGEEPFLTEYAVNLIKSGKSVDIPLMMGIVDKEGLFYVHDSPPTEVMAEPLEELFEHLIPTDLLNSIESAGRRTEIVQKIRKFYFKNAKVDLKTMLEVVNMLGDMTFACGMYTSAKIRQNMLKSPIFFSMTSFYSNLTISTRDNMRDLDGCGHSEDLNFIFQWPYFKGIKSLEDEERLLVDRYTTILKNFAKYGSVCNNGILLSFYCVNCFRDPTPSTSSLLPVKWLPMNKHRFHYMKISNKLEMLQDPIRERCEFWNEINKEYLKPFHY
jgi:carboxylesterase type B